MAQLLRRHPGCGGMGSHVIGEKGTGLAGTQAAGAGKGVDPAPASLASELSSGQLCDLGQITSPLWAQRLHL